MNGSGTPVTEDHVCRNCKVGYSYTLVNRQFGPTVAHMYCCLKCKRIMEDGVSFCEYCKQEYNIETAERRYGSVAKTYCSPYCSSCDSHNQMVQGGFVHLWTNQASC